MANGVPEHNASGLRAQAALCRRLAAATYDQNTIDILHSSAEEFEAEASKHEGKQGDPSAQGPPTP